MASDRFFFKAEKKIKKQRKRMLAAVTHRYFFHFIILTSLLLFFSVLHIFSFFHAKVYCCFLEIIAAHQTSPEKPEPITFLVCHIFVVRIFTSFYQINPLRCCRSFLLLLPTLNRPPTLHLSHHRLSVVTFSISPLPGCRLQSFLTKSSRC